MAELTMVFREYSTQGRCRLQEAGLLVVTQCKVTSRAWLARSACPLVWGWYPDDRLAVAPMPRQKARHTPDVNWGPRSETMFWGIPCNRITWVTSRSAVSAADGSSGRATKWTILENRSTTVRMVLLPLEVGRPVTKSRAMSDHSRPGMGRGRRRPAGGWWEALLREQTSQAATNSRVSASRVGHQKCRRMKSAVRVAPRWQASQLTWPHCSTLLRTAAGMKRQFLGPPPGSGWVRWAILTADSTPQVTTPTTRAGGRMVSRAGLRFGVSAGKSWDRASALTFLEPGR